MTDTPEKSEPEGIDPSVVTPEGLDDTLVEAGTAPAPLPVAATGTEVTATDPLSRYFVEISRYALLSREEEKALAVRAHDHGDAGAAQQLALANLRLVVKIAMDYRRVWTNVLDLIQEGNLGLLQGVQRFDPHRGVKLSTYAAYWIRAYILKYLIDNIRLVRVGSSRAERKLFFQLNRARRELERAGFEAEPKLLAEKLDVKESEVIDMERRLSQSDLSIDAPTSDESGSATFGDFLASPGASVESLVADEDMRATFREIVDAFAVDLDERGQQILRERVLADEPRTLQEIGDDLGVTRERVRQLEKKLVDQLREYLRENLVDFDYWAPDS